jgi:hypothetical protein
MKQADFDELIESVREGGRILRGEAEPSRQFSLIDDEDCQPEAGTPASSDRADDPTKRQ